MRASLLVSPIVAALSLAGCSGDTILPLESDAPASSSSAVQFDKAVLRMAMGDTARLNVVRSRGSSHSDAIRWRVADPSVAAVENGLVIPLAPGRTEVVASVGGSTLTAVVTTWGPVEVSSLAVVPTPIQVDVGATAQLDAELGYSSGLMIRVRTSAGWQSLDESVATVVNGQVTGRAAGQTRIVARMGDIVDTVAVTVGTAPDDAGLPRPGGSGSFVRPELPREYLNTDMPAVTGRSIRVPAGANLQKAIDEAQLGDEIVLDAGATYVGTFTLRKKSGDGWIIIRTSGTLPPEGTRVTPADAPRLARLIASHSAVPVINTDAGAHHYRLIGLEVTAQAGATIAYSLVNLGDGKNSQNTIESQPHHLVLDRMYVHGTPTLSFQRCVALHTASTAVIDSWLSECHSKGFDSQAIVGWNGTGPYKIVNNRLEGAGENVMFGGADPSIPNALPSDIEIRRNHFIKPPQWEGVWTAKNLLEFKIGRRVLVEGNVFENSWADAQIGFAVNLKSTNEQGQSPWGETSDITFRYNLIRNTAHGVSIAPNPQKNEAVPASRFLFEHNVFDRIGTGDYPGGRLFQVTAIDDLTISHNTAISSHSFLLLGTGGTSDRLTVVDNIFAGTRLGLSGDGAGTGTAGLDTRAPGWVFTGNVITGAKASLYPDGNSFPASIDLSSLDSALQIAARGGRAPVPGRLRISAASSAGADLERVAASISGVVTDDSAVVDGQQPY